MKVIPDSAEVNHGFQIAPMIDVVFVIMLFFMVMAGAMKSERELSVRVPGSPTLHEVRLPDAEIVLSVAEDGSVSLNDDVLDAPTDKRLPALTVALKRLQSAAVSQKDTILVTIEAAREARYERVIDTLNALAKAQIQNVTFAVASEQPF